MNCGGLHDRLLSSQTYSPADDAGECDAQAAVEDEHWKTGRDQDVRNECRDTKPVEESPQDKARGAGHTHRYRIEDRRPAVRCQRGVLEMKGNQGEVGVGRCDKSYTKKIDPERGGKASVEL